jgi:imidazoleglycerol-phosphate dehydratase
MNREASIDRKTKETEISLTLNLDTRGPSTIHTGIPFMDHMLTLMASHGFMTLDLEAKGDTEVDDHHTVEDLGICLGQAIETAVGDKGGIRRYGEAHVPMDEALARVVLDISNRPLLAYRVPLDQSRSGEFDIGLIREFFRALTIHSGITLHIDLLFGDEPHHASEAVFKAFGRALDHATATDTRLNGDLPTTKGVF